MRQTPKEQYPPRQSLRYAYRVELATLKSEFAEQIRVEEELAKPAPSRNLDRPAQIPPTVIAPYPDSDR
jgi:hypothetical protein